MTRPAAEGASRERPILFSSPMVRAILAGAKTQTRRAIKPQPTFYSEESGFPLSGGRRTSVEWRNNHVAPEGLPRLCPYGVPGDTLWVRETWSHTGEGVWTIADARRNAGCGRVVYRATDEGLPPGSWWPSIHMPREFSRITLEVTGVRVERLQDISEEDADAEGFGGEFPDRVMPDVFPARENGWGHLSMRECYARLWEHINGPGSWEANPWVWVVEFRTLEPRTLEPTHDHP